MHAILSSPTQQANEERQKAIPFQLHGELDGRTDVAYMVKEHFFRPSLHNAEYISFFSTGPKVTLLVPISWPAPQIISCTYWPLWQRWGGGGLPMWLSNSNYLQLYL